jgi:4-carboxymuconolactone decarboxylase
MNRGDELGAHVRGAPRDGVAESEAHETLMQAAIYAGAPASLEAFRIASEAIKAYKA